MNLYNNKAFTPFRRELRRNQTPQEKILWSRLKDRRLKYKFRRQYGIGPYIIDFYCSDLSLAIEIDGSQHIQNKLYDEERTKYLESLGCVVVRFWNNEIDKNLEGVVQKVLHLTSNSSPRIRRGGHFGIISK